MINTLRFIAIVYQTLTSNSLAECKPRNPERYHRDEDHEVNSILGSMNLESMSLSICQWEQPGDSSHEHTGVEKAPTLDTESTSGLAPCEGSILYEP